MAYEQQITSAIAYVTRDTVPTLHIATGHGELGEDSLSAFTTLLTNNHYDVAFEKLSDMTFASGDVLCILSPVKDYTDAEMDIIRAYVQCCSAAIIPTRLRICRTSCPCCAPTASCRKAGW